MLKQIGNKGRIFWIEGYENDDLHGVVVMHPDWQSAEDIANAFVKQKKLGKLAGGSSNYPNNDYSTKEAKKYFVPRSFVIKNPVHKPDFIDRLIAYESGELSEQENVKFLKEVKKKGLANKLQGHYGREIERRKI